MALDTYTQRLGLIAQATGNNNNAWGDIFNGQFANKVDHAIAGVNTIVQTSGTLDLSVSPPPAAARQDIDAIQFINATLVGDLTIIVPAISKTWWFFNNNGANFNVYLQIPGGTSPTGLIQIPSGAQVMVMCTGAGLYRLDKADVGKIEHFAGPSAPGGTLLCNGASLLRTAYPDLFAAIGTTWGAVDGTHFTLPNLTDTGRVLRSVQSGTLVGQYQINQNQAHTHTFSGQLSAGSLITDSGGLHNHTINVNDPTHAHGYVAVSATEQKPASGGNAAYITVTNAATSPALTGISANSVSAGSHAHNVTGSPGLGTFATVSQGGTEARPESAIALICIRY